MNKVFKWIFGIFLGLVAVVILAGGAIFVLNWWGHGNILVGNRTSQYREYGRVMPWRFAPQQGAPANPAPGYRTPMERVWVSPLGRLGGIGPLGLIFICLIGLGFIVLVVLGIVYLVSRKTPASDQTVPPATVAAQPLPEPSSGAPAPEAEHTCPHCGRSVQEDWSHCPYCGAPLSESDG